MDTRELVARALFGGDYGAYLELRERAEARGVSLSSIRSLYTARARGEVAADFTVPAVNLRGMTYWMARYLMRQAKELNAFWVFEIARSEMGYTGQYPMEYAAEILGAAIDEEWVGPLLLQGDHFQFGNKLDLESIKTLVDEAIQAGFYNLDIDGSTLVDLKKKSIEEQQKLNIEVTREILNYIHTRQGGEEISVGGEIGHIGAKNSTSEEMEIFLLGLKDVGGPALSKVSVQTGTRHGGEVDGGGEPVPMKVDFGVIDSCTPIARKYGVGGVVQHGASTLPNAMLSEFPRHETLEIHLATEWQNIVMDHPKFPPDLSRRISEWVLTEFGEKYQSEEECLYRERKKAWGTFQKEVWEIDVNIAEEIGESIQAKARLLLANLGMTGKRMLLERYTR